MLKIIDQLIKPKFYEPTRTGGNLLDKALLGFSMNNLIIFYDAKTKTYIDQGYQGNAMVYSIINKLAEKRKEASIQVFKNKGEKSNQYKRLKHSANLENIVKSRVHKKALDLVGQSDPLAQLLRMPNRTQNFPAFVEDCSKWWDISGEIFIYGVRPETGRNTGKVTEMYVLPSHLIEIIQGDMMTPIRGYKLTIGDQQIVFPPEDIKHIKSFNPDWTITGNQLRGQPPLLAGTKMLQKNNAQILSGLRSAENDGAKGVLSPDARVGELAMTLNAPQTQDLKQKIEEKVNGLQNKSKVVPSGLPMQYTAIGLSPVALDLIKSLEYDDEKLCGIWGVNPVIFKPTATQANLEIAQKALVTDCCLPFLNMLETALTEWLAPMYGNDYVLDFDVTSYAELQPDVERILNTYGKWHGVTPNEVRTMLGWDESEDPAMSQHWIPRNLQASSEALMVGDFGDFE